IGFVGHGRAQYVDRLCRAFWLFQKCLAVLYRPQRSANEVLGGCASDWLRPQLRFLYPRMELMNLWSRRIRNLGLSPARYVPVVYPPGALGIVHPLHLGTTQFRLHRPRMLPDCFSFARRG